MVKLCTGCCHYFDDTRTCWANAHYEAVPWTKFDQTQRTAFVGIVTAIEAREPVKAHTAFGEWKGMCGPDATLWKPKFLRRTIGKLFGARQTPLEAK